MSKGSRRRVGKKYGENFDKIFPPGRKKPASGTYIWRDGKLVPGTVRKNDAHNMVSVAAGVMPDQVPQLRKEIAQEKITGVKVRPDGDVVFRDRNSKLKYIPRLGLHDKNEIRG